MTLLIVAATAGRPLGARRAGSSASRSPATCGRDRGRRARSSPRSSPWSLIDPIEQYDEFKAPPTGERARRRRRRPAAGRRQRPLPVLGDGASTRSRAPRSAGSARAATRPTGSSTARSRSRRTRAHSLRLRDAGRARDRRLRAARRLLRRRDRRRACGACARRGAVAEAAPAAGAARGRVRGRRGRLDLGPPGGLRATVVAAALLTGPATLAGPDPGPPPTAATARSRRRFAAGVALLLVAWISICGSGLLLLSRPRARLEPRRPPTATTSGRRCDAANDAIDLQPWAAEPRTQLALVYELAGDYRRGARTAIDEAIEPLARRLPAAPAGGPASTPRATTRRRAPALSRPSASTRATRRSSAARGGELAGATLRSERMLHRRRRARGRYSSSSTIGSMRQALGEPAVAVAVRVERRVDLRQRVRHVKPEPVVEVDDLGEVELDRLGRQRRRGGAGGSCRRRRGSAPGRGWSAVTAAQLSWSMNWGQLARRPGRRRGVGPARCSQAPNRPALRRAASRPLFQ